MEKLAVSPTLVGLYEYSLVVHPDASAIEKIIREKETFATSYRQKCTAKTKPHITVANFLAREAMEDTIIRYTQRISGNQPSFPVELNNYSGFPLHTIFLRVQNPQPFKELVKELKVVSEYIRSCKCPPVSLISNPNLTIAKRLPESMYLQAMMEYSQKTFHETFMVNELVLLRRSNQYDVCKPVHVFRLQPPEFKPFTNTLYN